MHVLRNGVRRLSLAMLAGVLASVGGETEKRVGRSLSLNCALERGAENLTDMIYMCNVIWRLFGQCVLKKLEISDFQPWKWGLETWLRLKLTHTHTHTHNKIRKIMPNFRLLFLKNALTGFLTFNFLFLLSGRCACGLVRFRQEKTLGLVPRVSLKTPGFDVTNMTPVPISHGEVKKVDRTSLK